VLFPPVEHSTTITKITLVDDDGNTFDVPLYFCSKVEPQNTITLTFEEGK
jgi:hypothetical protein